MFKNGLARVSQSFISSNQIHIQNKSEQIAIFLNFPFL